MEDLEDKLLVTRRLDTLQSGIKSTVTGSLSLSVSLSSSLGLARRLSSVRCGTPSRWN